MCDVSQKCNTRRGRARTTTIDQKYIYLGDPLLVHGILGDGFAAVQRAHVEGSTGYPPRGGEEEERRALGGSPGACVRGTPSRYAYGRG